MLLGVAVDLSWPLKHHQGLVRGVLEAARDRGWRCALDPFLDATSYDGVIARAGAALALRLRRARIPAVNVWLNSPDATLPRALPDVAEAGALAARHLRVRGFRRFGFLGHRGDRASRLLLDGFRREAGAVDAAWIPPSPASALAWRRARRALDAWIAGWTPPFGAFAADDLSGRLLADACRARGLRLPDDVGIVGFGNEELACEMGAPALSSVDPGYERVGRRAVELLAELLRGRPARGTALVPPAGIVERASTDVFAVDDRDVARALRAIAERLGRRLRVGDVADAAGLSRRSLERRFRASLGRSVHAEITRARVERAKRLLEDGSEPLKRVARLCGFRTPPHFSRVFRRLEGTSPLAYRRDRA